MNGVYGYIDAAGTMTIAPRFSAAFSFKGGLARIELPGSQNQGFIDKQGAVVIPPQFTPASNFSEGLAAVTFPSGDSAFIDATGKVVTPHFSETWDFSSGLAPVTTFASHYKFGFIDKTGNLVIPVRYDNVVVNQGPVFSEGLAAVGNGKVGSYKYGYIDPSGNMVTQPQYDAAQPFHEGLAAVRIGNLWGYIDKTGKMVIPLQFRAAFGFSGDRARVDVVSSQPGFIDKTGRKVIMLPANWYAVDEFSEGLAPVQGNKGAGGFGFIDDAGRLVIPMQFDLPGRFSGGLALVSSKGKVGAIDRSGQIVIPLQFE
ncbi:MAG: WG repeat-containing protein [Thermomicrobiales bacterium]